jgi:hypothetical protein
MLTVKSRGCEQNVGMTTTTTNNHTKKNAPRNHLPQRKMVSVRLFAAVSNQTEEGVILKLGFV